ncbi:hypothetical protein NGRA_1138, partial [Nosema granulosis]
MLVVFLLQSILAARRKTKKRNELEIKTLFSKKFDIPSQGCFEMERVKKSASFRVLYFGDDLQFLTRNLSYSSSVFYGQPLPFETQDFFVNQTCSYLPLEENLLPDIDNLSISYPNPEQNINVLSPKTNFYHDVEHLFSFKNYSLCNNKKKD